MAPVFKRRPFRGSKVPGRLPWGVTRGLTARWPLDSASCDFNTAGNQVRPLDIIGNIYAADAKSPGSDQTGTLNGFYYRLNATTNTYLTSNVVDPIPATGGSINATLSIWVKYNSYTASDGASQGPRLWALGSAIKVLVEDGTSGSGLAAGSIFTEGAGTALGTVGSAAPLNVWTHVVVTYAASVPTAIYINGVANFATPPSAGFSGSANFLNIGCRDNAARIMDGTVADARIYNGTILTPAEINELYQSAFTTELLSDEEWPQLPRVVTKGNVAFGRLPWPYNRLSPRKHTLIGKSQIDWSHPLARGLKYFRLAGSFGPALLNLLGSSSSWNAASGSPVNGAVGREGLALATLNSSYFSDSFVMPQTAGTVAFRTTIGWSPTDGVTHAGVWITDGSNAFGQQKFLTNSFFNGWDSSTDSRAVFTASGKFAAGETVTIATTYSTSAVSKSYIKGALAGSGSINASVPSSTCQLTVGDNAGNGAVWLTTADSAIYYVAIWDRELSADEAALLDYDPYCFLVSDLEVEWSAAPMAGAFDYGAAPYMPFGRLPRPYNRLSPRKHIPLGRLRIDPTHPLANGLIECFLPGVSTVNLATSGANGSLVSGPTFKLAQQGPGLYATGGSAYQIDNSSNWYLGAFTVRALIKPISWPGTYTSIIDKGAARNISVFINTSGDMQYIEIDGSSNTTIVSTGMAAGGEHDFVVRYSAGTAIIYANGVSKATLTPFIPISGPAGSTSLGKNISTGGVDGDLIYFAYQVWNRALSADEIALLAADPYCFLVSDLEAEWTAGPAMSALYGAVRSSAATTANQKVYVEFVEDTLTGRADFGFATSGPDLEASYPGINSPSRGFFFRGLGQFVCVDSADHAAATPVYVAGSNVGIAFNTQTGRAWVRVNGGAWSNGGDPAAGTGGFSIPFAGPYCAIFHASTVNDKCTAKFASSSWTYTAPSGFTALDGTPTSSQSAAFLARATNITSGVDKRHYDTLISGLVTDGIFAKLDALYIFAAPDSATARLNLVQNAYNGTITGSLTFTAYTGFTGVAGTNYIDTGFAPASASGNYAQNSCTLGIYVRSNRTTDQAWAGIGIFGAGYSLIQPQASFSGGDNVTWGVQASGVSTTANFNAQGQWIVTRTASNATAIQKNGAAFDSNTTSSAALDFLNIFIFGVNSQDFSQDQMSAAVIGGGLTATEMTNLASRINTFMTAYGINVY